MTKKLVALVLHLPGLYFIHGYKPDRLLVGLNVLSLALAVLADGVGFMLHGVRLSVVVFLAAHLAWGAFLAARVCAPRQSRCSTNHEAL